MSKKMLTPADLEGQAALELPDRQMLTKFSLILLKGPIVVKVIEVDVEDVNVALALCTAILAKQEFGANACRVQQH